MFNKIKSLFFSKRDPATTGTSGTSGVAPISGFNFARNKNLVPDFTYAGVVDMYKSNPILAGCINVNAKTISALPMKLFAWTGGRSVKQ